MDFLHSLFGTKLVSIVVLTALIAQEETAGNLKLPTESYDLRKFQSLIRSKTASGRLFCAKNWV